MTLPPGYTRITDKAQLEAIMKAGGRADPKYKAILDQYATVGDRARIYAIKLGDTDFADNLNIIVDTADGMDADHIADLYDGVVKPVLRGSSVRRSPVTGSRPSRGRRPCESSTARSSRGNRFEALRST